MSASTAPMDELARLVAHLEGALDRLRHALAGLRPSSTATLPAVSATLNRLVESTEHAALRVLDEADALAADAAALRDALEAVRPWLPAGQPDAEAAWHAAAARCEGWRTRALRLAAAMEFQDLMAQQVDQILAVLDGLRARLGAALEAVGTPEPVALGHPAPTSGPAPLVPRVLSPAPGEGDRQALADALLAERARDGGPRPAPRGRRARAGERDAPRARDGRRRASRAPDDAEAG